MKKSIKSISAALFVNSILAFGANAETVSLFAPMPTTPGVWSVNDTRNGGTTGIADLTGVGGDLESNALGKSAAKLTTGLPSNDDKAQVSVFDDFGTMGDFINNGGSLSYDFYKALVPGGNLFATAAIKLIVEDNNTTFTGLGQSTGSFVYEPYWNLGNAVVPPDVWTTDTLTGNSGIVWTDGIYGQGNQAGGLGKTLAEWLTQFGTDFLDANIIGISVGVGTYNKGQEAYFDNILFSNGSTNKSYDFELAPPVPVPAALPLFGTGIAILGFLGWRRKRQQA